MPLGEAIDILRNATKPPLNIVVYWKDIDANAGIYRDTAIGFDGVAGLRLRQYLELLLLSLSATSPARIDYTVDHGVIVIATAKALPRPRRTTRVYDMSDLVAPPARWSFSPMLYAIMSNNMGQSRRLGVSPSSTQSRGTQRR